jgi:uncharacterized protein
MELYNLLFFIIVFGAIQSLVGVGLLLFGTPALLIYGYSYPETLWLLLPSSCALSLIQIFQGYRFVDSKKEIYFLILPILVFTLVIIINYDYLIDIKKLIGIFLILISTLKLTQSNLILTKSSANRFRYLIYPFIGLIHGLSNLGGAPLSVFMASIFKDRQSVNANIAFVYFILASSQLIVLLIYERELFTSSYLLFVPAVILNHIILTKTLFHNIGDNQFKVLINIITLIFGLLCFY